MRHACVQQHIHLIVCGTTIQKNEFQSVLIAQVFRQRFSTKSLFAASLGFQHQSQTFGMPCVVHDRNPGFGIGPTTGECLCRWYFSAGGNRTFYWHLPKPVPRLWLPLPVCAGCSRHSRCRWQRTTRPPASFERHLALIVFDNLIQTTGAGLSDQVVQMVAGQIDFARRRRSGIENRADTIDRGSHVVWRITKQPAKTPGTLLFSQAAN